MAKRGRPRMNGAQAGWTLGRIVLALRGCDQSRSTGNKHSAAVANAVAHVRKYKKIPEMRISETEVQRILAKLRPGLLP